MIELTKNEVHTWHLIVVGVVGGGSGEMMTGAEGSVANTRQAVSAEPSMLPHRQIALHLLIGRPSRSTAITREYKS